MAGFRKFLAPLVNLQILIVMHTHAWNRASRFMSIPGTALYAVGCLIWAGCGDQQPKTTTLQPLQTNAPSSLKTNTLFSMPAQSAASADTKWLADRKQEQLKAAQAMTAFHDFQFADRSSESQITFEHRSVDDANKNWKPVHYDHGTALAVADIDGDGWLDIYCVSQIGGNQLWRNRGNGTFENITATAGVGLEDRICVAASFADI